MVARSIVQGLRWVGRWWGTFMCSVKSSGRSNTAPPPLLLFDQNKVTRFQTLNSHIWSGLFYFYMKNLYLSFAKANAQGQAYIDRLI